ncbi:hypothetical protein LTR64_006997 [Lithohypha guttulata]|uniref:uncharacterized protein n=1 Tax=Lithohypha guttulata TaxID=1690604 RepID=UPI002DDE0910|nr:hypothetical protein LTR51_004445 [Lithohypha guttulata]
MLNLYKETAIEVKSTTSPSHTDIQIPRANGSYDRSKFSKKPERHDRLAVDEKSYAAEYLAASSSVFIRRESSYPRSFAWRVVSQQRVLEISNVDFARNDKDREADRTLAFEFQDQISPRGVSICDSSTGSEFHIFVLTQENEVFELRLQIKFFQDAKSIPPDTSSWCTPIRASSLSIDRAFQLHVDNPHDLFVSFASGKVQHWKRDGTDSQWTHINYDDKTWGAALFSIVSRKVHADIDFEGMRLAHNTTHAMIRSGQYLFTACLNHTLRVWHLDSGRLVDSRDLLDQARDPHDNVQLNPAEPGYIQFLEGTNKQERILLTCSPLNGGQIKLWRVKNAFADEAELFSIEDMAPNSVLSLPDPDPSGSSVWSLTGLRLIFDKHTKDWQAWVLWRNHNYHKVYTLNFSFTDISSQWSKEWVSVSAVSTKSPGPDFVPTDAHDVSSKWLDYLLFPRRYSSAAIETALAQYSTALDTRLSASDRRKSLRERLALLIGSQVKLRSYDESTMDYDRYAVDTDQQWRQFWRILENLNEGRYAPLALALDASSGMVMITMADLCCEVRECNNLELLDTNEVADIELMPQIVRSRWPYRRLLFNIQEAVPAVVVLSAAQKFFSSFPPDLAVNFGQTLDEDLYTKSDLPTSDRIVNFFNEIDFANAVPDDVEKELNKNLSEIGGAEAISNDIYALLLKLIVEHKVTRTKPHHTKTEFGLDLTFAALLKEIVATRQALLSLLAVVIFLDGNEQFNTCRFFDELVLRLRTQERNLWLATHYRSKKSTSGDNKAAPMSILQDIYAQICRPQSTDHHPMPFVLTQHIMDNLEFVSGESDLPPGEAAVYFQCNLLKHGEVELASDFLKFQPPTAFSTYIKGRLSLALGNYKEASLYFQEAADSLARGKALGKLDEFSCGLLTAQEAACFYGGLPLYLQHIVTLFEEAKAFNEAADVARRTLDALESEDGEPLPNFRQSVLLRLFNSELKCARFEQACDALVRFSDLVLQRTSATDLVNTMLDSASSLSDSLGVVKQIQDLPLSTHPNLANHVDHHLASLAKKQTSIPSAGGLWLSNTPTDYLSILHALRLFKKDYRGAVSVLFDRLRLIQKSGRARSDPKATSLRHALLAIINTMTCVKEDEAYIVTDSAENPRLASHAKGLKRLHEPDSDDQDPRRKRTRVVVTLDDFRREYQRVLDRCSRIERGDFEYGHESEDESDEEPEKSYQGSKLVIDRSKKDETLRLTNGDAMQLS